MKKTMTALALAIIISTLHVKAYAETDGRKVVEVNLEYRAPMEEMFTGGDVAILTKDKAVLKVRKTDKSDTIPDGTFTIFELSGWKRLQYADEQPNLADGNYCYPSFPFRKQVEVECYFAWLEGSNRFIASRTMGDTYQAASLPNLVEDTIKRFNATVSIDREEVSVEHK